MTLEEKKKIIEEDLDKDYFYISPFAIQRGIHLKGNYSDLEKYETMEDNTKTFSEKTVIDLITQDNPEKTLGLNLIYCGSFDEIRGNLGSFEDLVLDNKDKIIAIYRFITGTETRHFFVGISQTDTINKYDYIYIKLDQLLDTLKENNIEFKIDKSIDRSVPSYCRDDKETKFIISYNKLKEASPRLVKKIN